MSIQPSYDLILLCPSPTKETIMSDAELMRKKIVARARTVGLQVSVDVSRDADERLIKLSAHDSLLAWMAEHLGMEKRLRTGGYTDYKMNEMERFEADSPHAFFSSLERIRLIQAILELPSYERGCGLNLDDLVEKKVLIAIVPVHEKEDSAELMQEWVQAPCELKASQPLDKVRDYFGERIAFYFAFTEDLTNKLQIPAVLGIVLFIASSFYDWSNDNPFAPFYSLFMLVWITWFCKSWRR